MGKFKGWQLSAESEVWFVTILQISSEHEIVLLSPAHAANKFVFFPKWNPVALEAISLNPILLAIHDTWITIHLFFFEPFSLTATSATVVTPVPCLSILWTDWTERRESDKPLRQQEISQTWLKPMSKWEQSKSARKLCELCKRLPANSKLLWNLEAGSTPQTLPGTSGAVQSKQFASKRNPFTASWKRKMQSLQLVKMDSRKRCLCSCPLSKQLLGSASRGQVTRLSRLKMALVEKPIRSNWADKCTAQIQPILQPARIRFVFSSFASFLFLWLGHSSWILRQIN